MLCWNTWIASHCPQNDERLAISYSELPGGTSFIRLTCEPGRKYPAHFHRTENLLEWEKHWVFWRMSLYQARSTQSWSLSFPCRIRLRGRSTFPVFFIKSRFLPFHPVKVKSHNKLTKDGLTWQKQALVRYRNGNSVCSYLTLKIRLCNRLYS